MAQNDNGWKSTTVTKTIENLTFTFPIDGYAFDNREKLVTQFLDAIKPNCQLIGLTEFNHKINIKFYRSKQEMNKETPYPSEQVHSKKADYISYKQAIAFRTD